MKFVYSRSFYNEINRMVAFRTVLPKGHFTIRVAAGNVFRVFLNAKMIAYGPMRSAHGYCNVLSVSFDTGVESFLTVEIAGYNVNSYCLAKDSPFFGIEIFDKSGNLIGTCDDFVCYLLTDRIQKVNKYSMQRFFVEVYQERTPRVDFYLGAEDFPVDRTIEVPGAKLAECDLSLPTFDKIQPESKKQSGNVIMDVNAEPYDSDWFYPQKEFCTEGFTREQLTVNLCHEISRIVPCDGGAGKSTEYRMPYNATGFIEFSYVADGSADIYVAFDELPFDQPFRNSALNAIKLSVNGKGTFLSFEPYTLKYAKIYIFGDAQISDFHIVAYENPDVKRFAPFTDAALDTIFRAAARTFAQNAVDILTDCPSRERGGWLCDSYFTARAEKLLTGGNKVEKNTLRAFLLAPSPVKNIPYGMLPMCYPADHYHGIFIANWALWLILELKDYLQRTGDKELIDDFKPKVYDLLKFMESYENEFGLIENMDSWVFVEWSKANDFTNGVNYPSNMLYAGALNAVAELYGDKTLSQKADRLTHTIRTYAFNGEFFVDNAVRIGTRLSATDHTTETCQYYAFYFGIADRDLYPQLYDTMFNRINRGNITKLYPKLYPSNAFIGNVLRLDYLAKQGRIGQTISECKDYYLYMAERTGTLWEHNEPSASCNHGFASIVAVWIAEYYSLMKEK